MALLELAEIVAERALLPSDPEKARVVLLKRAKRRICAAKDALKHRDTVHRREAPLKAESLLEAAYLDLEEALSLEQPFLRKAWKLLRGLTSDSEIECDLHFHSLNAQIGIAELRKELTSLETGGGGGGAVSAMEECFPKIKLHAAGWEAAEWKKISRCYKRAYRGGKPVLVEDFAKRQEMKSELRSAKTQFTEWLQRLKSDSERSTNDANLDFVRLGKY